MTDQANAALIEEARGHAEDAEAGRTTGNAPLYRALADALEAAEQRAEEGPCHHQNAAYLRMMTERDALAAVVEKVRVARGNHPACEEHPDGDVISCGWKSAVLDIDVALASAPADALREVQAEAWDEGFDAYEEDHLHHDAHGWGDEECIDKTYNPYRSDEQGSHNGPQRREEQS